MSSFLIIYSSTDGHTKRICERIKSFLNEGSLVKLVSLKEVEKITINWMVYSLMQIRLSLIYWKMMVKKKINF